MKTPESYARRWCTRQLGSDATADAREKLISELTPFFEGAMKEAAFWAERKERERLPERLRAVVQLAYDAVFDVIMNKPTAEACVERLLKVSPSLHAALYPSMHG